MGTNDKIYTFGVKCHLSHLHAKLDHFDQSCDRKVPIRFKSLCFDDHWRCNCILVGTDPTWMLVDSTGTSIPNNKIKKNLIFFLCSLLLGKKAISVLLFHSLSSYWLLVPGTLLKAQDRKANLPQPCPSETHNQKKRKGNRICSVSGETEPRSADNDPHQCVDPLDSAICPHMRCLL